MMASLVSVPFNFGVGGGIFVSERATREHL